MSPRARLPTHTLSVYSHVSVLIETTHVPKDVCLLYYVQIALYSSQLARWDPYPIHMDTIEYIPHRALFAYELARLRKEQGLNKTNFATMVGVSRRYLIKLEAGEASPTLDMIERLAAGLAVPTRDLVDFDAIARRKALRDMGISVRSQES